MTPSLGAGVTLSPKGRGLNSTIPSPRPLRERGRASDDSRLAGWPPSPLAGEGRGGEESRHSISANRRGLTPPLRGTQAVERAECLKSAAPRYTDSALLRVSARKV